MATTTGSRKMFEKTYNRMMNPGKSKSNPQSIILPVKAKLKDKQATEPSAIDSDKLNKTYIIVADFYPLDDTSAVHFRFPSLWQFLDKSQARDLGKLHKTPPRPSEPQEPQEQTDQSRPPGPSGASGPTGPSDPPQTPEPPGPSEPPTASVSPGPSGPSEPPEPSGPSERSEPSESSSGLDRTPWQWIHLPANNMAWVTASGQGILYSKNILRHELWEGRETKQPPHGRSLEPLYSELFNLSYILDSATNSFVPNNLKQNQSFVMFMPYLHWEERIDYRLRNRVIREVGGARMEIENRATHVPVCRANFRDWQSRSGTNKQDHHPVSSNVPLTLDPIFETKWAESNRHVQLVRDHLYSKNSDLTGLDDVLHVRRTLDQFRYPTLSFARTEARDEDQVYSRYTKSHSDRTVKERLLMVDQLWLWKIDHGGSGHQKGTSLPSSCDLSWTMFNSAADNSPFTATIITAFPERWTMDHRIGSGADMVDMIRKLESSETPNSQGFFADPSDIRFRILRELWSQQERSFPTIAALSRIHALRERSNELKDSSFLRWLFTSKMPQPREDTEFPRSLKDLESCLRGTKIGSIEKQLRVEVEKLVDITEEVDCLKEVKDVMDELKSISAVIGHQERVIKNYAEEPNNSSGSRQCNAYTGSLKARIQSRKADIQHLRKEAESVSQALGVLLDLKQKQATVFSTYSTRKEAEETSKQNAIVLTFTVTTIIYATASLIAAIFSMNAFEVNGTEGRFLRDIFNIMWPTTAGVFILSMLFTFSGVAAWVLKDLPGIGRTLLSWRPVLWKRRFGSGNETGSNGGDDPGKKSKSNKGKERASDDPTSQDLEKGPGAIAPAEHR
ncbi:hypothetical protein QBC35DRAFT_554409 [Podospora australis]|uniref:Uncharacterized protein n=1 Tax=Podospora australis TaxID=1536484 RepID=A0AAN7AGY4_9PEZI|nr:hypothetical protein QBC35DRAFT_554409 [Podospora australis]